MILVRHGESEGNRDRRFTQSSDVGLTPAGEQQAKEAGSIIREQFAAAAVIASPFRRAEQTGQIIAEVLGLPLRLEDDLREQNFGALAGQPYEAMMTDLSDHVGPRWEWRPRGGESLVDVYDRAVPALERIAIAHPQEDVVVVSHGGVMFALGAYITGSWETSRVPPNCGIFVVEHVDKKYKLAEILNSARDIT
ncbi:MAG TPA: histidine phosphatase family protein [Terriglobales bacterium]|nr:histidine phosphatase family protein [Terriglobales bacterium]